jgi:DNA-binding LytR/AlgR family response regulator
MKSVRLLIVDDEPLAIKRLEILIQSVEWAECCGTASGCDEAVDATLMLKPDIVLLDIRMRDGTGFDYLKRLPPELVPIVIFVTAFDSHAIEAFTHNALDYVLKPIDLSRLLDALRRAQANIEQRSLALRAGEMQEVISNLRAKIQDGAQPKFDSEIWVRRKVTGFVRIAVTDIDWIAAEDDYVRLNLADQAFLLRSTLGDLQKRLDSQLFLRIHRSTIVRREAVVEFRKDAFGFQACLKSGEKLRVGRIYAKNIRHELARSERGSGVAPLTPLMPANGAQSRSKPMSPSDLAL